MPNEGQQIGAYTLISRLGKGGFGEVWLAEKRSQFVTKRVALKLPHDDQINLDAIRQEAELWEQASGHANVLPIIDADIYNGQVIIVSEYAEGGSLFDKIKREGRLPLKLAVEMTVGILNGLEFLHSKRIIHRDIKPQNILLQGNTPRLADFGISRAMQTTAISSTIIGTDAYMAPEAFEGKRSVQTDIWAVGVVLYQLLTGSLPFPQEHPSERMFAILQKEFFPLPDEIPGKLRYIVKRSLEKMPENRYFSASQMRDDLQQFHFDISASSRPRELVTEVLPRIEVPPTQFFDPKIVVNPDLPEQPTEPNVNSQSVVTRLGISTELDPPAKSSESSVRVLGIAALILISAVVLVSGGSYLYSLVTSKSASATRLTSFPSGSVSPEATPTANLNRSTTAANVNAPASRNLVSENQNAVMNSNANDSNKTSSNNRKMPVLVGVFGESKSGLGGMSAKVSLGVGTEILTSKTNNSGYARFNEVTCDRDVSVSITVEGEKRVFKRFLKCSDKVTEWTYVSPYADSENTPLLEQRK